MNDPQFWITTLAIVLGPILAVQITELLRHRREARARRLAIFRSLMATRSATLTPSHIEALNVVDVEFHSKRQIDRKVVEAWKLYLAHLSDRQYPQESWGARKADLLIDLLSAMATTLGFDFDKSHIKQGTYYPTGYQDAEADQLEIRKRFLEILRGDSTLPVQTSIVPIDTEEAKQIYAATSAAMFRFLAGQTTIPVKVAATETKQEP